MSLVFIGINHKKPFLPLALISGVPLNTLIHKNLDHMKVSYRSLIGSKNPFDVPYCHFDLPLRSPTSTSSTSNPRTSIKDVFLSTRTPRIMESP